MLVPVLATANVFGTINNSSSVVKIWFKFSVSIETGYTYLT